MMYISVSVKTFFFMENLISISENKDSSSIATVYLITLW